MTSKTNDLECTVAPVPVNTDDLNNFDPLAMYSALQELQNELNSFLVEHTQKVMSLHTMSGLPKSPTPNRSSSPDEGPRPTGTSPPTNERRDSLPRSLGVDAPHPVELHTHHLKSFLQSHIHNIRSLHDALPNHLSKRHVATPSIVEKPPESPNEKLYNSLTDQFNMLVVIATFTASLIISFISLVKTIIDTDHRIPFDVGMLLSFFAMNLHFGNIIVAGRGAALTSQYSAVDENYYNLAYFNHYLALCEQLQVLATSLFLVSIVILSFYIFSSVLFPLILLGVSILGTLVVFWSAYWKVSITLRNLKFILKNVHLLYSKHHVVKASV